MDTRKMLVDLEVKEDGSYMLDRTGSVVTANAKYVREFKNEAEAIQFCKDVTRVRAFNTPGWSLLSDDVDEEPIPFAEEDMTDE